MLAGLVEGLDRAPKFLTQALAEAGAAGGGPPAAAAADAEAAAQRLEDAGGLPLLRALPLLLRSSHNSAVLVGMGLLPALLAVSQLCQQKLTSLAAVLALRGYQGSSSGSLGDAAAAAAAAGGAGGAGAAAASAAQPPPAQQQRRRPRQLHPLQQAQLAALATLLDAALAAAENYLTHSAAFAQKQVRRGQGGTWVGGFTFFSCTAGGAVHCGCGTTMNLLVLLLLAALLLAVLPTRAGCLAWPLAAGLGRRGPRREQERQPAALPCRPGGHPAEPGHRRSRCGGDSHSQGGGPAAGARPAAALHRGGGCHAAAAGPLRRLLGPWC